MPAELDNGQYREAGIYTYCDLAVLLLPAAHRDPENRRRLRRRPHTAGDQHRAIFAVQAGRACIRRIKRPPRPLFDLPRSVQSEAKRRRRRAGPTLVREITPASASVPEAPVRRRRDADGAAPCAQPIACRGLESTAQDGKTEGERLSRTAARAGPGTAAAGRAELQLLSHRGGRGSSRSAPHPRCRR